MYQFLIITLIAEFFSAIAATFYFYKYKSTLLWLLLPLLWYIPINETVCQFIFPATTTGYILYNLYQVITAVTILIMTKSQLKNKIRRRALSILTILCVSGYFANAIMIDPLSERFSWGSMISAMIIVIGLLYYLIELLKSDQLIYVNKDLFLWISTGFLIFFLAYPVLALARKFLVNGDMSLARSINYIHFIIAIVSYLTIAFGFYYGEKREPLINTNKIKKDALIQ